jgi:hypothetical protein
LARPADSLGPLRGIRNDFASLRLQNLLFVEPSLLTQLLSVLVLRAYGKK